MQEMKVQSLGREDPLEKKWQPTSIFLPGKLPGQRSLVGYNPRGHTQSLGNPVWYAHVLEERKQGGDLDFVWTFSYSVNTVLLVNVYLSGMLLDIGDPVVTKIRALDSFRFG